MKKLFWTAIFTSLGCWQMLAGDALWENLTAHKIDAVSVIYLSESVTNRTEPSADFLKQNYTHLFAERAPQAPQKPDAFYKSLKNLLSSSQPVGPIKPAGTGEFRWCITATSGDSTTEIFISRGRNQNVARIGSDFYKLDDIAARQFFNQFAKLFGLR